MRTMKLKAEMPPSPLPHSCGHFGFIIPGVGLATRKLFAFLIPSLFSRKLFCRLYSFSVTWPTFFCSQRILIQGHP